MILSGNKEAAVVGARGLSRVGKLAVAFLSGLLLAAVFTSGALAVDNVKLGTVTGNGVYLRENASTSSKIYTLLAKDISVAVLGKSGDWTHVAIDGMDGYIHSDYLKISDSGAADLGYGQITASVVNIRSAAATSGKVLCQMAKDAYVHILGIEGGWYKVSTENGKYTGYIHPEYLKPVAEKESAPVKSSSSSSTKSSNSSTKSSASTKTVSSKSSSNGSTASKIISIAEQYLGTPYVWGGSSPSGFDCGGFTYYVYKKIGITLPRTGQQSVGDKVSRANLKVGDLVFFKANGSTFGHVGIYAGGGMFIHAPKPGSSVRYTDMSSGYYYTNFVGARRVIG